MNKEAIFRILRGAPAPADNSRLLFPDGAAAWRERAFAHSDIRRMAEEMKEEADRFLQRPLPHLPWSLFRRFEVDGSRLPYEKPYFEKRTRLTVLAMMDVLYPEDTAYREALYDTLWSICDEYTWCLPAHLTGRDPETHVDLFAAETAFALAEILTLTRQHLPERIASRIDREARRRVLDPYLNRGPFGWEDARHNWSAVCAGSVGAAAIYLMDDARELAGVLEKALASLDCYLDGFADDGVCQEGYGYWAYGFGFFVYFADLLKKRTHGAIDLISRDKVAAVARFPQHCFMSGRKVANFSDTLPEAELDLGLFHFLHARFPDVAVPQAGLRGPFRPDPCGRWAPAIRGIVWRDPELAGEPWGGMSVWFPDAQWLLSRHAENGRTWFFAAKGGHNGEPHNHNDIGHFILHADGDTFLMDLGCGEYTADYFGARRYAFIGNSSLGHSVPIIGGAVQREGAERRAIVLEAATGAEEDVLALDISGAYPDAPLARWVRTFVWRKTGVPLLRLEDAYRFSGKPVELVERFITPFPPEFAGNGCVVLSAGGGRGVCIRYDGGLMAPEARTMEFAAHDGGTMMFHALDFKVREPESEGRLVFAFSFIP